MIWELALSVCPTSKVVKHALNALAYSSTPKKMQ